MIKETEREQIKLEKQGSEQLCRELSERVVGLNDIVTLNLIGPDDDAYEIMVKLIDGEPYNLDGHIKVISTSSPIGKAIRGQKLNTIADYEANGVKNKAQIIKFEDDIQVENRPEKVKKLKYN